MTSKPWDVVKTSTKYIDNTERMNICRGCPRFVMDFCRECGCFMPLKTAMEHSECPLGKW